MIIKNANILCDDFNFKKSDIRFSEKIEEIGKIEKEEKTFDFEGCYVIPGLVDIHTHAAVKVDAMDENVDFDKWKSFLLSKGVTTFFPSTVSATPEEIKRAVKNLDKADGINLEGPFLSPAKKGAHLESTLCAVDLSLLSEIKDKVKITTVAPEMFDNMEKIEAITKLGIKVSLGHTTANYETSKKAFSLGATHITHSFNAMPTFLHREPGLLGAAFENENVFCEVISDGIHLHPAVVKMIYQAIGCDRMVMISDSMAATGLDDGKYSLGGLDVIVKDRKATLKDGTIAGSTFTLYDCVKNAVSFGIPLTDVIKMATLTPAKAVSMDDRVGSLSVSKDADIVVLDKDLNVVKVFYKGKEI
ncbi:MAG: N-acetylglucosamine-6-phosphate deacetylase [Clostridia bacterium]|nr:N-acetylglucosamine-6-phosphate deacetylase [Clostridia bacterium]